MSLARRKKAGRMREVRDGEMSSQGKVTRRPWSVYAIADDPGTAGCGRKNGTAIVPEADADVLGVGPCVGGAG